MRTSEEYRGFAAADWAPGEDSVRRMLRDAADLIDAVAWASHNGTLYPWVEPLLAAYRASLRPQKPASGCEGCRHAHSVPDCVACDRFWKRPPSTTDRWEAEP